MTRFLRNTLITVLLVSAACMPQTASAQTTEKWVDLHNKTSGTITRVWFSEPYADTYIGSTDFLGSQVIGPDSTFRLRVRSQSCLIDMKVRFYSGVTHELRFNICSAEHVDDVGDRLVVAR